MPRAYCLIRSQPYYRADAFVSGLKAAGYEVQRDTAGPGRPGDVLLMWNRYAHWDDAATRFERAGGTVLVAENGYLGAGGTSPKFDVHPGGPKPHHYYALGLGYHNDASRVVPGGPERFASLGVELRPWRTDGEHILVCPNRSFGPKERIMPIDWAEHCAARLRKATRRPVRIRPHPGNDAPKRTLQADLEGAWACFVWSSGSAVHALAAGVPTFIEAPFQVVKGAGASGPLDVPITPERLPHFERMAFAQWRIEEIQTGFPFMWLPPRDGTTLEDCKAKFDSELEFTGAPTRL